MHHFTDGSDKHWGLSSDCETSHSLPQECWRDMHGQCLSSDQARVGTRGLANHVGVLAVSLSLNLSLSPSLDLSLSLNLPLKTKTPASR